jgi:hypothetical protein
MVLVGVVIGGQFDGHEVTLAGFPSKPGDPQNDTGEC